MSMSNTLRELTGLPDPWPMKFEVGEIDDGRWYLTPYDADGTKGPSLYGSDPVEVIGKLYLAMNKAKTIIEEIVSENATLLETLLGAKPQKKDWKTL